MAAVAADVSAWRLAARRSSKGCVERFSASALALSEVLRLGRLAGGAKEVSEQA